MILLDLAKTLGTLKKEVMTHKRKYVANETIQTCTALVSNPALRATVDVWRNF
jgi:hypothetical protein